MYDLEPCRPPAGAASQEASDAAAVPAMLGCPTPCNTVELPAVALPAEARRPTLGPRHLLSRSVGLPVADAGAPAAAALQLGCGGGRSRSRSRARRGARLWTRGRSQTSASDSETNATPRRCLSGTPTRSGGSSRSRGSASQGSRTSGRTRSRTSAPCQEDPATTVRRQETSGRRPASRRPTTKASSGTGVEPPNGNPADTGCPLKTSILKLQSFFVKESHTN
jgi:hypothetical protein